MTLKTYKHLSIYERDLIAVFKSQGKSLGELPDLVPDWFSRWAAAGLIVGVSGSPS